jgi:hypothetical protein
MRPRDAKSAASQTDIAAILSRPEAAARLIATRPSIAKSASASMNQIHICVSNSSGRGSDVFGIAGPTRVLDWTDDIAANLGCSCHVPKEIDQFLLYGHQLGDRFPPLCDDNRAPLPCDLIHQAQAVRFEICCCDVSNVVVHNRLAMVI